MEAEVALLTTCVEAFSSSILDAAAIIFRLRYLSRNAHYSAAMEKVLSGILSPAPTATTAFELMFVGHGEFEVYIGFDVCFEFDEYNVHIEFDR